MLDFKHFLPLIGSLFVRKDFFILFERNKLDLTIEKRSFFYKKLKIGKIKFMGK
jgi:hypothetical protein